MHTDPPPTHLTQRREDARPPTQPPLTWIARRKHRRPRQGRGQPARMRPFEDRVLLPVSFAQAAPPLEGRRSCALPLIESRERTVRPPFSSNEGETPHWRRRLRRPSAVDSRRRRTCSSKSRIHCWRSAAKGRGRQCDYVIFESWDTRWFFASLRLCVKKRAGGRARRPLRPCGEIGRVGESVSICLICGQLLENHLRSSA
jgi:hypothetical protein